jgi:hypothetical protein
VIYHGIFGSGFFQRIYRPGPAFPVMLCTSLEFHLAVNAPLLLMANWFSVLWPLALMSASVSMAVCAIGAAQAPLPDAKLRFWSRPLVALLFFLQPITRGWARHKWRLDLRSRRSHQPSKTCEAVGAPCATGSLKLAYWGQEPLDRYFLLKAVFRHLEVQGWQIKLDAGWSGYDAELSGSRWCRLRLTTASEELGEGRRFFRYRIEAGWSALSWIVLSAATVIELIVVINFATYLPWLWMGLLTLPILGIMLDQGQHQQLARLQGSIDAIADEMKMQKYNVGPSAKANATPAAVCATL